MAIPVRATHGIPPVYDGQSRILLLGSFPSTQSRESRFYYAHPRNRFWPLIASLLNQSVPATEQQKIWLLLSYGIALWDVIASCTIAGSSDSSIRDVVANDLSIILNHSRVTSIFTNGTTAHRLYGRYQREQTRLDDILLPSTSPANARMDLSGLEHAWSVLPDALNG